ncbi:MAG: hypothetical protein OXI86_04910, partial [Candidatus Poribacteria bacterium]|nr:hypothetical protein [Candidatus Poribacteria bacterium]
MKHSVALACCLAFLEFASIGSGFERPEVLGNYLKLNIGEYLYAEDNPSLDFRLRSNFAVEFWFKLETVPETPSGQRVLLLKPGSYAFVILAEVVIELRDGDRLKRNIPTLYIMSRKEEGRNFDIGVLGLIGPGEWHHFAFETWLEGGVRRSFVYYNGNHPNDLNLPNGMWCDDTDNRFYIGSVPDEALDGFEYTVERYGPFIPGTIYMDELQLSLPPVGKPRLNVRPKPNPRTMALWRFSEGT